MSRAYVGLGLIAEATQLLLESLELATGLRPFGAATHVYAAAALFLAHSGQVERAVELYARASEQALVAISRWFYDVYVEYPKSLANDLPPRIAEAAKERGRSLDCWQTIGEIKQGLLLVPT